MPGEPRVLVIRRRYLGDVVLLGPLFRSLRAAWPSARLAALVEPDYAGVLALNPDIDLTLAPPRGMAWGGFLARLRSERFTHVLDVDNTQRTALIARLSGASRRVVLHHGSHTLRLASLYTDPVYDPEALHESRSMGEYYLRALEPLGVPIASREPRLVPSEEGVAEWRRFVGAAGPTLLVHPGSRSLARVWPAERFAAVCDRVQDELGAQVVLVGGPSDGDILARIRAAVKTHVLAVAQPPPIAAFAALAKASNALLCHDSGPMHVAAAVGTPVIALYGSQNPLLFRPSGEGHTLLLPSLPCSPCLAPQACVPSDSYRTYCVRQHSIEQVFAAAAAALGRARG